MSEIGTVSAEGRSSDLVRACGVLTLAMLLAWPAFAAVGYWRSGMAGIAAASIAGGVCWGGDFLALLLVGLFRGGPQAVHGALGGMLFRVGMPLMVGILLTRRGGPLAEVGVFGMIVVYYLFGLLVETLLAVRLTGSSAGRAVRAS